MPKKKRGTASGFKDGDYDEITDDGSPNDEYFSPTDGEDSEGRPKPHRITMYCKHTHYETVKDVGRNFCDFHLSRKERSDWDIAWFDGPNGVGLLKEMSFHQRTNHYPGIFNICNKKYLGRHLIKMQRLLPQEYDFFPRTYLLPYDHK